jgi:hypothetical protein
MQDWFARLPFAATSCQLTRLMKLSERHGLGSLGSARELIVLDYPA